MYKAIQLINMVINIFFLGSLVATLCYFFRRKIFFEPGFKLIFINLILAFMIKTSYYATIFSVDWQDGSYNSLKFIQQNMYVLSYLMTMNSFDMLVAKLFALLYALAKLRLTHAIKLIKVTNKWIFRVGLVLICLALTKILIMFSIFLVQPEHNQTRTNLESYMGYETLICFIVQGCAQLVLLAALYPMQVLYNRSIKKHSLITNHTCAVRVFTSVYVIRSLALITHAGYACVELHQIYSGQRTEFEVSMDIFQHEILYFIEDLMSGCTLIISVMFFAMITRNYQLLRDRLSKMSAKGHSKHLSVSDRTGFHYSFGDNDCFNSMATDAQESS